MGFLGRLGQRLGFILALAVGVRVIGGAFSPAHPPAEAAETVDFGGHRVPKAALATTQLAAPLDDPHMKQALATLPFHGDGPGAKMTYRTPDGPVTLTPNDVAELNRRYRRIKGS